MTRNPTLPETNIAPENGWLEDVFPFGKAYFQVLCLVSRSVNLNLELFWHFLEGIPLQTITTEQKCFGESPKPTSSSIVEHSASCLRQSWKIKGQMEEIPATNQLLDHFNFTNFEGKQKNIFKT